MMSSKCKYSSTFCENDEAEADSKNLLNAWLNSATNKAKKLHRVKDNHALTEFKVQKTQKKDPKCSISPELIELYARTLNDTDSKSIFMQNIENYCTKSDEGSNKGVGVGTQNPLDGSASTEEIRIFQEKASKIQKPNVLGENFDTNKNFKKKARKTCSSDCPKCMQKINQIIKDSTDPFEKIFWKKLYTKCIAFDCPKTKDVSVQTNVGRIREKHNICGSSLYYEDIGAVDNICKRDSQRAEVLESKVLLRSRIFAQRAFYAPPASSMVIHEDPRPQFCAMDPIISNTIIKKSEVVKPVTVPKVSRTPISCPISSCKQSIFISDFVAHYKIDHQQIPFETISPGNHRNSFLNLNILSGMESKCLALYLVTNKVQNLVGEEFKDFLPILLMASMAQLQSEVRFVVVWLTGLVPENVDLHCTLTVWCRFGSNRKFRLTQTGKVYNIRNPQSPWLVYKSGQCLHMPETIMRRIANDEVLELQLFIQ